uniref:Uncharacterized protein n=1 Tax=Micrurus paraensis TaxID=1970185 RepID=A0A2D4KJQ8_9SAUR
MEWLEELQLEENPVQARWSLCIGHMEDPEKHPSGVTLTKGWWGDYALQEADKEYLLLTHVLQLLRKVLESQRAQRNMMILSYISPPRATSVKQLMRWAIA